MNTNLFAFLSDSVRIVRPQQKHIQVYNREVHREIYN